MTDHKQAEATGFDPRHGRLTLGIGGLAALATYLDTTILFVAFPGITASFGDSSASTLSWVLNAYTIVFAALLVPAGKLADRFGHRFAFLVGSAVFSDCFGCLWTGAQCWFTDRGSRLSGRGGGDSGACIVGTCDGGVPRERLPQVIAIWGAIGALSAALGPSLGALIIDAFGWRWAFFINLPIGVVTIAAGIRFLRETKDSTVRIPSFTGVVLITLAAGTLLYGLVESDTVGWASAQTIVVLIAGLVLLGVFIAHQRITASPTLDLEMFNLRNFRWGNLAMLSFNISFTAMFFGLILFLVNVWEWSILKAGLGVAPGPALAAILAPRFGKLAGEIGQRPLVILGGLIAAASGIYRVLLLNADVDYLVDFAVPLLLSAIAIGLVFPQVTSVAVQTLPPNRVGVGGATTQAVRQFGGSLGVALTIAFLGSASGTIGLVGRFNRIWWLVVAGGIATTLCALPLRTGKVG